MCEMPKSDLLESIEKALLPFVVLEIDNYPRSEVIDVDVDEEFAIGRVLLVDPKAEKEVTAIRFQIGQTEAFRLKL